VEFFRLDGTRRLDPSKRGELGQFMTTAAVARFMAHLFVLGKRHVRVLDAGAGVGSLTAAFVEELCGRREKPQTVAATAFEVDAVLAEYLGSTLDLCRKAGGEAGIAFQGEIVRKDFVAAGTSAMREDLFSRRALTYDCAILNPPYKKIRSDSEARRLLQSVGIETSNLYTGFLAIAIELLTPGGELVAITPRSFCNGPYFKPFRERLLSKMRLQHIHVFETRDTAFSDDEVLQETVIFHAIKGDNRSGSVVISASPGPDTSDMTLRDVPYDRVVEPGDPDFFIRIVADETQHGVARRMAGLPCDLPALGLTVSTGRVVDFRAKDALLADPTAGSFPLIYPTHFDAGAIAWPKPGGRKPNALAPLPGTDDLLVPSGWYTLTKRFSAKEETRRVVAAVFDPDAVPCKRVGFENHLNYFHRSGKPLPQAMARGLAAFLDSTMVDEYFRQFNGHTQVNATDLRSLRYPTAAQLEAIGARITGAFPPQEEIDRLVEEEVFSMQTHEAVANPLESMKKIDDALRILKVLNLPREQQNERSALTLLALLALKARTPWPSAAAPFMGVTPIMDFVAEHYGKKYAPNTRETFRRFTLHQFLQAGLVSLNPDDPKRPVNSPDTVYQVTGRTLGLLRAFDSDAWIDHLEAWRRDQRTLRDKYAAEREMQRIPVKINEGSQEVTLSPGGQNELVKLVVEEFCSRYTPGATVIYIGDAGDKWAVFDGNALQAVGVDVDPHGKMPDVVVHFEQKNWLVLIEAVTSHGPVNPKRREELHQLFAGSKAGLVFVTAFLSRSAMVKYLNDISWETEVWVADAPSHMIHFNGVRFLGPYDVRAR